GDPTFQGQARLVYSVNGFGFNTNINYVGQQLVSRFNRAPQPNDTREFDKYSDFVTIDSSISYSINKQFRMVFSVTNLTNRVGQDYFGIIIPATIFGSGGDALGRRFAITASAKF
ncbi:MAG: TonB-dependent receptor, partial [Zymomonas sp.]|nr:TonB-dependent receptor [Zymomonas sp.]